MLKGFFQTVTRNPIGLVGAALTTASAILILALFGLESTGLIETGPYVGILAFLVLPGIFVLGLVLIPIGYLLERRRERRAAERGIRLERFPIFDLNDPRARRNLLVFLALTTVNVVILALATYKGVEVMDSTGFCGTVCHSVMIPEYTTYQRSPHARVPCVSCHIGPGANWFVKSKLSGSWQVIAVAFNLYPRPIPTPVANLRPARETCEQCHWPSRFVGDRLKIIPRHSDDEASTETDTVLLMRVGGQQGTSSKGIHWHVDPKVQIRYLADARRENIREVRMTLADGAVKTFTSPSAGKDPEVGEWRVMDCVDCHNRPTHIYRMPKDELDAAIHEGRIDGSLPFIHREGLKALEQAYPSHEEARRGIRARILDFYSKTYPQVLSSSTERVEAAARELGTIYCLNVYPSMNITWGTYNNHIGHQDSPGCFRCHDGEHKTEKGEEISQDCSMCHSLLAVEEHAPAILKELQP